MEKEAARKELQAWAAARRESDEARGPLIRDAFDAGVQKQEIHEITGLARTTINDILREGLMAGIIRARERAKERPDEYYLAARDRVLAAVAKLDPKAHRFTGPAGILLDVKRKMPLRVFILGVARLVPGEDQWMEFNFERNGRVNMSGRQTEPVSESLTRGHLPWASRGELEDLAAQLEAAAGIS